MFPDGILYASRDTHYSIFKAARMYRMECEKVNTLTSGEIDCVDFKAKLLCHKDKPAIINVNIGIYLSPKNFFPMCDIMLNQNILQAQLLKVPLMILILL